MTASKHQVQLFLREFKMAAGKGTGIYYAERDKNWDILADTDVTTVMRNDLVLGLTWKDYCGGPMVDDSGKPGEVWLFGASVLGLEVYIKLKLVQGSHPKCISFHKAEHPLKYPFRS